MLMQKEFTSLPKKPCFVQIFANTRNIGMVADTGVDPRSTRFLLLSSIHQIENKPQTFDLLDVYFDCELVLKLTSLKKTAINKLQHFYQYYPCFLTRLTDSDRFIVKPPVFLLEWEKEFCQLSISGR